MYIMATGVVSSFRVHDRDNPPPYLFLSDCHVSFCMDCLVGHRRKPSDKLVEATLSGSGIGIQSEQQCRNTQQHYGRHKVFLFLSEFRPGPFQTGR